MSLRASFGLLAGLLACSHAEPAGGVAETPGAASLAPAAPSAAPSAAEAPLAWGTRPAASGDLFPVVDGQCIHMDVWPMATGAIVTWGNPVGNLWGRGSSTTVAKVGAGGLDLASTVITPIDVAQMGPAAGGAWAREEHWSRVGGSTMDVYAFDGAQFQRALDGSTITKAGANGPSNELGFAFELDGHSYFEVYDGEAERLKLVALDGAAVPAAAAKAATLAHVRYVRRVGDAYLGIVNVVPQSVWRVGPAGAPTKIAVPGGAAVDAVGGLSVGPAYWAAAGAALVRIDAADAVVVALPVDAGTVQRIVGGAAGPFVLTDKKRLFHVQGTTATEVEGAKAVQVVASTQGTLWFLDDQKQIHERKGGVDRVLAMPEPPWAATGRYAVDRLYLVDDAVMVNASYVEKGLAWKKPEPWRALLSTKRPNEVRRCHDANDNLTSGSGYGSWPPKADAACKTPLMVWYPHNWMTTRGYEVGQGDYKTLRGVLASVTPGGVLLDIELEGKKVLAQRMTSLEEASAAAKAATKKMTLMRPQLVCAEPAKVLREVPVAQ